MSPVESDRDVMCLCSGAVIITVNIVGALFYRDGIGLGEICIIVVFLVVG